MYKKWRKLILREPRFEYSVQNLGEIILKVTYLKKLNITLLCIIALV